LIYLLNKTTNTAEDFCSVLKLIADASLILEKAGRTQEAVLLYESLHSCVVLEYSESSLQSLLTLLAQAQFLCQVHQLSQAWEVVMLISCIQCNAVGKTPDSVAQVMKVLQNIRSELKLGIKM
jgi:hypothetical protein